MPSAVGYQPNLATEMGELQERITSTKKGSVTSVQAIYVPADDLTDPAPATTFAHLDATTVLSRQISGTGYLSRCRSSGFHVAHSRSARGRRSPLQHGTRVKRVLQSYKDLQDIIAILGIDELSEDQKLTVSRARKIQKFSRSRSSWPSSSLELKGRYVKIDDTVRSFQEIVDGKHDDIPEQAFYMKGDINEVLEEAEKMKAQGVR